LNFLLLFLLREKVIAASEKVEKKQRQIAQ